MLCQKEMVILADGHFFLAEIRELNHDLDSLLAKDRGSSTRSNENVFTYFRVTMLLSLDIPRAPAKHKQYKGVSGIETFFVIM